MNIKQIKVFLAAARTLNFTRVSEEIFLTQQAVSRLIIDLENELGISLFERTKGGISLTDEGRYLSNMFHNHIQLGKSLLDVIMLETKKRERYFRFGYSTWIDPFGEIDNGLTAFRNENAEVVFSGCLDNNKALSNMLLTGELDVAIIPGEQLFGDDIFEYFGFAEQDFHLFIPDDIEGELIDRDCWGLPLLAVTSWNWDIFEWKRVSEQELSAIGIKPKIVRMLPDVQSIIAQLETTRCAAVLDRRFGIGTGSAAVRSIPLPGDASRLFCVWHRDNESSLPTKFARFLADFYS